MSNAAADTEKRWALFREIVETIGPGENESDSWQRYEIAKSIAEDAFVDPLEYEQAIKIICEVLEC